MSLLGIAKNLLNLLDPKERLDKKIRRLEDEIKELSNLPPRLRNTARTTDLINELFELRKERARL